MTIAFYFKRRIILYKIEMECDTYAENYIAKER